MFPETAGYHERVLANLGDVPVERGRVGAMSVPSYTPDRHKPYVYRGTGEDQLVEVPYIAPKPKPPPKRKPKKRKPRPRVYRPRFQKPPTPEPVLAVAPEPPPEPPPPPVSRPVKPATGWQPMTGADIDDLLDTLS